MESKLFTTGNLGNDAKVVNFEIGKAVITFSIATNTYFLNPDGEKVQKTTWHECKKFVKSVNEQFVKKLVAGAKVTIFGTLAYDEYDKEVTKTKSVKIKRAYIDVKAIEIL